MEFNGKTMTVFSTFATVGVCDNIIGPYGWSSKNIVDKLCPAFEESGTLVTCWPVEGYPLEVVSTINDKGEAWDKITLTHNDQTFTANFDKLENPVYFGSYNWLTGVLEDPENGLYQHNLEDDSFTEITDPENYRPPIVRNIVGLPDANGFFSDCGNTTVRGMADPKHVIGELTNEVEALQAEQNKQYELIEEVTLTEAVASFTRNKDTNGVAYNFSAVRACANFPAASAAQTITFVLGAQGSDYYIYHNDEGIATDARQTILVARNDCGICDYYYCVSQTGYRGYLRTRSTYIQNVWKNIKKVTINAATTFPIGTVIKIYGIRG